MEPITSTTIVESFAHTHLKPVWNEWGDGVHTACAVTALDAAGVAIPLELYRDVYNGWDDRCLREIAVPFYAESLGPQRLAANQASLIAFCRQHRVARGAWQWSALRDLIECGTIQDPSAGRHPSYVQSLQHLLKRLVTATRDPIYYLTDARGRQWISGAFAPEEAESPVTGIVIYYQNGAVKEGILR